MAQAKTSSSVDSTFIKNDAQNETQPVRNEEKKRPNLKYLRDKDREKVKGIFRFYESPGHTLNFSIRLYKEDPVEKFSLVDGMVYTIPLGVARHLNKNGWYPIHQYMTDENGAKVAKIGQKVRRFRFESLEFVDIEDLTPEGSNLVSVELTSL